jgi:hypothetical protein
MSAGELSMFILLLGMLALIVIVTANDNDDDYGGFI